MSLLGKILALFNLFGAVAFIAFAAMDYGKRSSWSYAGMIHELRLDGLPYDDKEADRENVPVTGRFGEQTLPELFKGMPGTPVATQAQEVIAAESYVKQRLASFDGKVVDQTLLAAKILLPFAESYDKHAQYLAVLSHFADDKAFAALKARFKEAQGRAAGWVTVPGVKPAPFGDTFRLAFHANGGRPANALLGAVVEKLPEQPAAGATANVEKLFDDAVAKQLEEFVAAVNVAFDEALGKAGGKDKPKAAAARAVLAYATYRAEEESQAAPPKDRGPYQAAVIDSPAFKGAVNRLMVVFGLKGGTRALSDRAAALRRMADAIPESVSLEREQFLSDHATLIAMTRNQADLVRSETMLLNTTRELINTHDKIIKDRREELRILREDLAKSEADTAADAKTLRDSSSEVLRLRTALRDAIRDNARGEEKLRELEKMARDLDAKASKAAKAKTK